MEWDTIGNTHESRDDKEEKSLTNRPNPAEKIVPRAGFLQDYKNPYLRDLTSQEYRKLILPSAMAGILVLMVLLINVWFDSAILAQDKRSITYIVTAFAIYIAAYGLYLIPARRNRETLVWVNSILSGIGFWALTITLPHHLNIYVNLLLLLVVISISTFAGRIPTLMVILITLVSHLFYHTETLSNLHGWTEYLGITIVAILLSESTMRIQEISHGQIQRLEIINTFSHQVAAAKDRQEVFNLINSTIPNALVADSYYISAIEADEIHVIICYDDGEYFNNIRANAEGTLTNWVDKHQQPLFLPDLRQPIDLEDIRIILIGKDKTSLSWIGVPMTSSRFQGILALASYEPNAFNRGDLELLSNLSRHAVLAIENVDRQAELTERAQLDSLTGVYNHGYFLEILKNQAEESIASGKSLSLIMLDVDFFKIYNDTYGHLAGDKILTQLCTTIRNHIKSSDAVGRWGGEEFIISLPNTRAEQAMLVAERISASMRGFTFPDRNGRTIPPPTVSQGIAIFPDEADEIFKLIDLADQRLYIAKNRGRDQIESAAIESLP